MELTDLQKDVLNRMRKAGLEWVASATEREWSSGNSYYIDSRCKASQKLRRDFNKCNEIATSR